MITYYHFNNFSYYFDNGNIASETMAVVENIRESKLEQTFVGQGYFRIFSGGTYYVIQYMNNIH